MLSQFVWVTSRQAIAPARKYGVFFLIKNGQYHPVNKHSNGIFAHKNGWFSQQKTSMASSGISHCHIWFPEGSCRARGFWEARAILVGGFYRSKLVGWYPLLCHQTRAAWKFPNSNGRAFSISLSLYRKKQQYINTKFVYVNYQNRP